MFRRSPLRKCDLEGDRLKSVVCPFFLGLTVGLYIIGDTSSIQPGSRFHLLLPRQNGKQSRASDVWAGSSPISPRAASNGYVFTHLKQLVTGSLYSILTTSCSNCTLFQPSSMMLMKLWSAHSPATDLVRFHVAFSPTQPPTSSSDDLL